MFTPSRNGTITHVRVYAVSGESGRHTASIWDNATGTQLRSRRWTYAGAGWKEVQLSNPLQVTAGKSYTVAVTTGADNGRGYAAISGALTQPGDNGASLTWPANAGVFDTNLSARPTQVWNSSNYLRDVIFVAD